MPLTDSEPITAEQALEALLAPAAAPLRPEKAPVSETAGRVLSSDLRARLDGPPFTNSARDGYAVRAADLAGASMKTPAVLPLAGAVKAGARIPRPLPPGRAVKVMTGAPLPPGADAVVMREVVRETEGAAAFLHAPAAGEHVRPQGEDFRRGDVLLKTGTLLRPWEVALLASQGLAQADVFPSPRAAVVVTGDEVSPPGASLRPGAVHDSNGPALSAALIRAGAAVSGRFRAPDDLVKLSATLRRALVRTRVVLVSGGVSAGDHDHTRAAFLKAGARILFHRVAIRPGGPLLAAAAPGGKFLIGLPGNPLSALVCFGEFVVPLLKKLRGLPPAGESFPFSAPAANGFRKPAGLKQFLFVRREGGRLRIPPQGSALMRAASGADALAVAPRGVEHIRPGDPLEYRVLA